MPKLYSTFLRLQIRLIKPMIRKMNMETQRKAQERIGRLGANAVKNKVSFLPECFMNFDADWAIPLHDPQRGVILYMHGGGYTSGCLEYSKGFGGILAEATKRKTLCIGYRLAPENPFPAALDDALDAYKRILETVEAKDIILAGESAGGGLAYALALKLKAEGLPLPGGIIAVSPWTDLAMSGRAYKDNARRDPSLNEHWLRQSAYYYGRGHYKNPYISPVYGDLSGLPPCLIYAGSYEMLMDDAIKITENLKSAGVDCETHIMDGMWHAYVLFGIYEAREALKRIVEFIDERTKAKRQ